MYVLALVTDAFGSNGGIAQYNRDFLTALATSDSVKEIFALPRLAPSPAGRLPKGLHQLPPIADRVVYSARSIKFALSAPRIDAIFCGHILMAPLAALLCRAVAAPMWLQVHGIDAWGLPTRSVRWAAEQANLITSVSRYTRHQMLAKWWNGDPVRIRVLPNSVDPSFTPGPRPSHLLKRFDLNGRRILLTVSRIALEDSYKGHARVLKALPHIRSRFPDVIYMIAGDGDGRAHLERLVENAGLRENVRFVGWVTAEERVDYYRLADVFVMPSTKEGFGIVFLEAAACGTAVVGGKADGSWDALREGSLGAAVDPDSETALIDAVCQALEMGKTQDSSRVDVFSKPRFTAQVDVLAREFVREHLQ